MPVVSHASLVFIPFSFRNRLLQDFSCFQIVLPDKVFCLVALSSASRACQTWDNIDSRSFATTGDTTVHRTLSSEPIGFGYTLREPTSLKGCEITEKKRRFLAMFFLLLDQRPLKECPNQDEPSSDRPVAIANRDRQTPRCYGLD